MAETEASPRADAEDLPSDFFDDFNKAEFIESLSVIDSWDEGGQRPGAPERRDAERREPEPARSTSADLDRYIQPGSRRNPDKTNEAIRRDKDRKVKEYLQKSLEQDIRPPGTELDDFLDDSKSKQNKEAKERRSIERSDRDRGRDVENKNTSEHDRHRQKDRPRESERHRSPIRERQRDFKNDFQHRDFRERERESRFMRGREDRSPGRHRSPFRRSPNFLHRPMRRPHSPQRRSPPRRRSRSPARYYDRRASPRRSPRRRSSRSPRSRSSYRPPPLAEGPIEYGCGYYPPGITEIINPGYGPDNGAPYGYPMGPEGVPPSLMGMPPGPMGIPPGPVGIPPPSLYAPRMVPAPMPVPAPSAHVVPTMDNSTQLVQSNAATKTPYDALAQLYAEGKISKVDYLKLAPNKDVQAISSEVDSTAWKEKHELMKRVNTAQGKLLPLRLPATLLLHNQLPAAERRALPQRFASPLKRRAPVAFAFTSARAPGFQAHNRKTLDAIVAAVGLEDEAARGRRRARPSRDAATQTARPACDACDVRDATERCDAATAVDAAHFTASAHTQVLEAELASSRAVFAPSGGVADTMSIAHLTPAQLVSQLAARAKTLKDAPGGGGGAGGGGGGAGPQQPQYMRRDYDYGGYDRQHGYNNYRY